MDEAELEKRSDGDGEGWAEGVRVRRHGALP
jgi:hypothetical protein